MNRKFFLNHDALIGIAAFLLCVIFTHTPFFLYIPVPGVSMDTFNYFWFAMKIYSGELPVINQPHDFPWGYPLFLFIGKKVGFNILHIVIVQTLIYTLAGWWLIRQYGKAMAHGGVIAGMGLALFTILPFTIRYNFMLYMESLYISFLFLLFGSIALYFRTKKTTGFFFVVLSVFFLMLIRPNGILMMLIPLLILLAEALKRNRAAGYYTLIVLSFLTLNAVCNHHFKGKFAVGDSDRIKKVAGRFAERFGFYQTDTTGKPIVSPIQNQREMIRGYAFNMFTARPSFYFSLQKTNYQNLVAERMDKNDTLKMFDGRAYVDQYAPGLRNFVFENYPVDKYATKAFANSLQHNYSPRNKWFWAVHIVYEIVNKTKVLLGLYLLFFISAGYFLYKYTKEKQNVWAMLMCFSLIHLINLFSLPLIHNQFQARYIHVTEFAAILVALTGLYQFSKLWLFKPQTTSAK